LFYGLIDVVVGINKSSLLTPYLSKIEQILPWAEMSLDQRVEAYQNVFKLIKNNGDDEQNPLLFAQTILFLKMFGEASNEEILKYKAVISASIVDVIQNNEQIFELGELLQIQQI
jgi:hypothetical protein